MIGEIDAHVEDGRVVDDDSVEVVCYPSTNRPHKTRYHRLDADAYRDGTVTPRCTTNVTSGSWILVRVSEVDAQWSKCSYQSCYGDFDPEKSVRSGDLALTLEGMSVEEFDRETGVSG